MQSSTKGIYIILWACAKFKYRLNTSFKIRSANKTDYGEVIRMKFSKDTRFFGPNKLEEEREETFFNNYATHRIIISKWAHTMGYAEFMNFPLIPALPHDCYMDWLNYHFCVPLPLSMSNTIFLNYFVFKKTNMPDLLFSLLSEVLLREPKLLYILTVEMPYDLSADIQDNQTPQYFPIEQFSKVYYPRVYNILSCKNTQRIHVIHRDDILPKIRYRHALPQDNDELVDIISADFPQMREEYGDFFIAEQLLREDEDSKHIKIIVTEINLVTMGFFWLNDNVDILCLIQNFEIGFFNYLIKFDPNKNYRVMLQEMRQLTQSRNLDLYAERAIDNIFNSYDLMKETQETNENDNIFSKLHYLDNVLNSASYYLKPYDEVLHVRVNLPETLEENNITIEQLLQAQSNVFALQFFGLKKEHDLRRISRILLAMFVLFKERDYCIISLPKNTTWTTSLTELLKFFIRVIPHPEAKIKDYVFITHRSTVLGDIIVKKITAEDVPHIENFLKSSKNKARCTVSDFAEDDIGSTYERLQQDETIYKIEECVINYITNDVLTNPTTKYTMLTIRFVT